MTLLRAQVALHIQEKVDNCFYAIEQSHARFMMGGRVGDIPASLSAAASLPSAARSTSLAVFFVAWLMAHGFGRRRH
jgi:hypothetical protein